MSQFLGALKSLNYEGFITVDWNEEVTDPDIVLTHFVSFMDRKGGDNSSAVTLYENRSKTGTFPWEKYKTIDATFSDVLDTMVSLYPDQYAFK